MSQNPIVGTCNCPLCKAPGAEVLKSKEGQGKPYLKCDECVSMIRTSSARGAREMLALVTQAAPSPAAEQAPPPDAKAESKPKDKAKPRSGFSDALSMLGGGR